MFAKALKLAEITGIKQRAKGSFVSSEPRNSYGYNETRRRQLPEQRYPSCLTDAEWARVTDLFEIQGRRGVLPHHSRDAARTLLCNALQALMAHAALCGLLIARMPTRPFVGGVRRANLS